MDVQHHAVAANGIRLHVVEAGSGPAVILCHGFPESWYSWRHQIEALVGAGYRVVAPDLRGYGGSDAPDAIGAYTIFHLVGDLVGLSDALALEQPVLVGHDWGATLAWQAALMRPDRFRAVAGLSVPFVPRGDVSPLERLRQAGKTNFYQLYFQEPGLAEADLERDVASTFRRGLWTLSGGPDDRDRWSPMLPDGGFVDSLQQNPGPMPWATEQDIAVYAETFSRSGFCGPLNWYRNIDTNWSLMAPYQGLRLAQPALFVTGARDPFFPFMKPAVEALPHRVLQLRGALVIEGAGHWLQQEAPEAVNAALVAFLGGL